MKKKKIKQSDWWVQGRPYNCNQCGRLCYQGVLHVCHKALPVDGSVLVKQVKQEQGDTRVVDKFSR